MTDRNRAFVGLTTGAPPAGGRAALEKAFEDLKSYAWGSPRELLEPIDGAVAASHGDAAARASLEDRLAAVLKTDAPAAAKDYVCRKLRLIGTARCVPALAPLLRDERLSHMARFALERIPFDAAVEAMREALPKTKGLVKIGLMNSLGVRRDAGSIPTLAASLGDPDAGIASAAAAALGAIGTTEAAKLLEAFRAKAPKALAFAAADACLTCAERLLADGKKAEAIAIYRALRARDHWLIREAALRGLEAARARR